MKYIIVTHAEYVYLYKWRCTKLITKALYELYDQYINIIFPDGRDKVTFVSVNVYYRNILSKWSGVVDGSGAIHITHGIVGLRRKCR